MQQNYDSDIIIKDKQTRVGIKNKLTPPRQQHNIIINHATTKCGKTAI